MRNLLFFLSLCINIVFILMACSKNEPTAPQNTVSPLNSGSTARGESFTAGASFCAAPRPQMTYGMVSQMTNNYKNNQWQVINGALGMTDARAACFNLDSLENYICNLKAQVAAADCPSLNNLGIRFYYAAYSNPAEGGVMASYQRKHTLIMIPTYKNAMGLNVDFDPALIDPGTCTPLPLTRVSASTPTGSTVVTSNSVAYNTAIYAMDHPVLTPPPSGGMAF